MLFLRGRRVAGPTPVCPPTASEQVAPTLRQIFMAKDRSPKKKQQLESQPLNSIELVARLAAQLKPDDPRASVAAARRLIAEASRPESEVARADLIGLFGSEEATKAAMKLPSEQLWRQQAKKQPKFADDEVMYREGLRRYAADKLRNLPGDFPLELVAPMAEAFVVLGGETCEGAVDRTLKLLDVTKRRLDANKQTRSDLLALFNQASSPDWDSQPPKGFVRVPFGVAIRKITGQTRSERASSYYAKFLERLYSKTSRDRRSKFLRGQEAKGVDAFTVARLGKQFRELS